MDLDNVGSGTRELEAGSRIELHSAADDQLLTTIHPEPERMSASEKQKTYMLFSGLLLQQAGALPSGEASPTPVGLDIMVREANALVEYEETRVVLALLESDRYLLTTAPETVPRKIKNGMVIEGNRWRRDEEYVHSFFFIDYEEWPALRSANDNRSRVTTAALEEQVHAFNALDLEQRKDRFEKHLAARSQLHGGEPAGLDQMAARAWRRGVAKDLLPWCFRVSPDTFTAVLQQ